MAEVKLYFGDNEFVMGSGVTTIGRSEDNFISFPEDSNVSRYHAEIETRGNEYCLIDLNSSNGTTVNGVKVNGEAYLKKGDEIVLGGSSKISFGRVPDTVIDDPEEEPEPIAEESQPAESVPAASPPLPEKKGSNIIYLIAGAAILLALLFVGVAAGVYFFRGSSCNATARFLSPDDRSVLDKAADIEIDIKNGSCVAQVVYTVDGRPFASSIEPPFTSSINPSSFPDLADGQDHALGPGQPGPTQTTKEISTIEMNQFATSVAKQLSGGRSYNVTNPQFLREVQRRAPEFAKEGYFQRALKYRDAINVAYVREQNLDASLGYLLAMSRSGFDPTKKGNEEGLWRMTNEFITANNYNGLCGMETIGDPSQNCAAKASALYMKALVLGVFEGDMIYAVAAFGKSTADAAEWKSKLPANRTDVWNSIKTAPEREQLVRFFAASIVAENPQRFGLKNDRPLSELYRLTM
jgi:pSer/pThr/pTyr-binding forkhead associated (FHA) protein